MKDEDIESFKRFKIRGAQITIDGPPKIHDARRISIDGSSTFDKLVNRANDLLNANLEVIVRINIDKENLEHVDELLEILRDRIERHEKLKIDLRHSIMLGDNKDIDNIKLPYLNCKILNNGE